MQMNSDGIVVFYYLCGMKHLLAVIVTAMVLVAVVTGCGGAGRNDARLVAADSLMQPDPDSALALVQAVPPGSLTREGDRAYRDLLLTQARYKAYITASSDSDINRALDYYRRHSGERKKLTRAYIYKGAVMEELGHPDSAMFYYKHAEATADEKDYTNLGQINIRIASLYRMYYADKQNCFDKYKQALVYYRLINNKAMQQLCLYNMAVCSSISKTDNSIFYLQQSLDLANELNNDLAIFQCKEFLCRQLLMSDSTRQKAKAIAIQCLKDYPKYINHDLVIDLAYIYAKEKMIDSARYYLKYVDEKCDLELFKRIKVRKLLTLAAIANNEGKIAASNYYGEMVRLISDSINNNTEKYRIQQIENTNNVEITESKKEIINSLQWKIIALILVSLILISVISIYHFRRIHRGKAIINELKHSNVDKHEHLLKQIDAKDSVIELFVQNMVSFMQTTIDTSENDSPSVVRKRIKETITSVVDDEFWQELKTYINKKHNNLIAEIAKNPKIKEIDLRFIELLCCGFNYIEIAITLNYTPKYISQKRKEIAKKLNLKVPLQDFLILKMNEN